MKIDNVEDLIEILAGLHNTDTIDIEKVDKTIIYSIARQTYRGKALTDRQLDVMIEKLNQYKSQFTFIEDNQWHTAIKQLRMPLREIDRRKYVKICTDTIPIKSKTYEEDWQWIEIRFPFNKNLIVDLQDKLASKHPNAYFHERGSHQHFFKLTERTVYDIVTLFKNKEFDIDQEILEGYESIEQLINRSEDFVPGIYNTELKNLPSNAVEYLQKDIGLVTEENLVLYKDRSIMFGIHHFDDSLNNSASAVSILASKLAFRSRPNVFINSTEWNTDNLVQALHELKRFPAVVVVPENDSLELITNFYNATRNIIPKEQQSVLFRLDNEKNYEFNQYIKENNLNNSLANDLKIVYISENKKIPKPLLESDIVFKTSIYFSSFMFSKQHIEVDLSIQYDTVVSQHSRFGFDKKYKMIEEV